ncbi:MAG: hypothetical protein JWP31_650 [Aeromicrobium sp.]|nr:hypothetical protein [Aeromicrobium sp.]
MRPVPSPTTRLLVTGLIAGLAASLLLSVPARAAAPAAPGSFTGYGFDACVAPSQTVMDSWNLRSPFSAVGIYVSGSSRYCGANDQPNLSKSWVQRNAGNGWRFLPIHVGRQAPCFKNNPDSRVQKRLMSSGVTKARGQAREEARETIAALTTYGFGRGSVSYLDIEWYARTAACDRIVLEFTDAWTEYLHSKGYTSGVYSSGSAAIAAIDEARAARRSGFTLPDHLWIAWGNRKANTDGGPYLSDDGWRAHQRIHQYQLDVKVAYGGHTLAIDKNYLDVGRGSVAARQSRPCGVTLGFAAYPSLAKGSTGPEVAALECLLHMQGYLSSVDTTLGVGTVRAINRFRSDMGWSPTGRTSRAVWTALLAHGTSPRVLKYGSVGQSVWRLQRALIAAGLGPRLSGRYDGSTVAAVKEYRRARGLPAYTTTEASVWSELRRGKTA